MFSSLIPRKTQKGKNESLEAYQVKELYFICRYNTPEGKLEYQTFFNDLKKYANIVNFDKLKLENLPKRGTLNNWPKRYDWEADYKIYEEFLNGTAQEDLQLMYIKNMRTVGVPLIEIKTNIVNAIHKVSKFELPILLKNTYVLAKLGEFLNLIDDLIQKDIEFGQEEDVPNEAPVDVIPIAENPPWLNKDELKARNDYVWDNLPKRE